MSRAKLFNMIKSRGEHPVGRNPFDLTNRHVYTQKVAKIMPVKAFHTMPDDYLDVTMSEFSQNNIPMNTAAFLSGKKELLAYFVPYNTIWHNYNQFQATREDPESAALKVKGISYEPRFALSMLYFRALYFTIGSWMYESYSKLRAPWRWYQTFRNASGSSAWLDFMNQYGQNATLMDLIQFMKDNHYASSAMNDWEHFVRMSASEISKVNFHSMTTGTYSFPFGVTHDCYEHFMEPNKPTYGDTILDMFGTPIWSDWIAKLDMLRYGNLVPLLSKLRTNLDARVEAILDGLFTTVISPSAFTLDGVLYKDFLNCVWASDLSVDTIQHFFLDYVYDTIDKLTAFSKRSTSGDYSEDEYVNVYALYSYNKCFYDYMRNVYYDTDYSVYNYNCDFVDCTDFESSIIAMKYLPCRFYHLECHQWKKDMFTGVLPSNQLGAVSQVSVNIPSLEIQGGTDTSDYSTPTGNPTEVHANTDDSFNVAFTGLNSGDGLSASSGDDVQFRTPHTHVLSVGTSTYASQASFDVLALKRAQALQEYAQDLMRAGNRTQDIFNQIYGVTPKSQMDESPYFIDVASSDININPIIATAATGNEVNGRLGDIAARVTISTNKPLSFKFSTKDFGVVLFLSYIVPDSMYNSYNLDPCVTHLDPESHGLPYFQNLGLQPIIGSYLNNLQPVSVRNRVCGYAPPYIERKTDIDLVHGILVDTYLPKVTETGRDDEYNGELSHWVVARTDMQQDETVSLRNFYIDPRIVDNVFRFSADSTPSTDHFLTYASITINAVRALSELGLPRF